MSDNSINDSIMDDNPLTNITLSLRTITDEELIQYRDPTKQEPFVYVLLVQDLTILEYNQTALNNIRNIASDLQTFSNPDRCIDYITNLSNEKVIFNICDPSSKTIIPLIHDIPQISTIYITSDDEEYPVVRNIDLYPKIQNVHDNIMNIFEYLSKNEIRIFDNYLGIKDAGISLAVANIDGNMHRQDTSFMYGQILKDILLTFPSTNESKEEMI